MIELAAESLLVSSSVTVRALVHWSIVALSIAPACWLIAWRGMQVERELAAGAERDSIRGMALALATEDDPERLPALLATQALELTGARACFLARPERSGFRVELMAGEGPQRVVGQLLPIDAESPGLAGEAVRTGSSTVLPDTWCEAGLAARRELALSDRIRSVAVVPLVVRGEVHALIGLYGDVVGQLNLDQAGLLDLWAQQASGPFENALLSASVSQLDAAKHLDQLKTEFISAMAHELRAPLSPMLGWSELLLAREYSRDQMRPMLENIHEGAKHLSVLVGDLLDLSRGEAGRLALELDDLNVDELLETAVERWKQQAASHSFVLAVAGPLPARADRHRIRQVLDNLLSNATKYSPPGSRVFVTARLDPGQKVVVRVSDQGLGLTSDECARMFTKFYRTDSARKSAPGTGLGLALCRLIVEAHGGEIKVESEGNGHGSAFTFGIPAPGPTAEGRQSVEFAAMRG